MSEHPNAKPDVRINGVHHLAISTKDIRGQIEFFSDVLGAELVALFWMHGVPGGWHGFCRLNDHCSVAFVQLPANAGIVAEIGVTHAGTGAGCSAPGTMQHVAFNVDTVEQLLAMRDRIRSRGINVIGQIDHGLCQSIYFAGPENLVLEVATSEVAVDPRAWIDPEVASLAGISEEELARFVRPVAYRGEGGTVAQPPVDMERPQLAYSQKVLEQIMSVPDEQLTNSRSYAEPPVKV
jgi:catechol 2,3-dioxygenase-like lactoylglutathione lyase family enzyme